MKGARKTVMTFGEDFGLVQIPIAIAPVSSTKSDVKTERLAPSGEKIERREIDPATGEVVAGDAVKRGVSNGDGYVEIDGDDWATITDETKPTEMEVVEFVDAASPLVRERLACATDAHFVQPQPGAAGSLGVIVQSMKADGVVAVVRFGAGSRQRLGVLKVRSDDALVVQTVPFAADIAAPDEDVLAPMEAEVSEKAAKLGKQLIKRLKGKGSALETATDEAIERRLALVEAALAGKKPTRTKKAKEEPKADVEAALEAVLG